MSGMITFKYYLDEFSDFIAKSGVFIPSLNRNVHPCWAAQMFCEAFRPHKEINLSILNRQILYVLYTIQFFSWSDVILHLTLEVIMSVITDVF